MTISDRYPQSLNFHSFLKLRMDRPALPKDSGDIFFLLPVLNGMTEWHFNKAYERVIWLVGLWFLVTLMASSEMSCGRCLSLVCPMRRISMWSMVTLPLAIIKWMNQVNRREVVTLALSFCEDAWLVPVFSPLFSMLRRNLKFCASRAARQTGAIGLPRFLSSSWPSCCSIPMIQ